MSLFYNKFWDVLERFERAIERPFLWLYGNTMKYNWDKHFGVNFIGMVVLARHTSPALALFICIAGSILKEFKDNHWRMVVNKDTVGDLIADSIGILLGWFYGV